MQLKLRMHYTFEQAVYNSDGSLGIGDTWPQSACALPHLSNDDFDWQGDICPGTPLEDLIIYEMHVRGFTQDPSSKVESPGMLTICGKTERNKHSIWLHCGSLEIVAKSLSAY